MANPQEDHHEYDHEHHDHEHTHEHHDHEGHDHEHEDHDHEEEVVDGEVNVSHHESALICSSRVTVRAGYDAAKKAVEAALKNIAAWVDAHEGYVGHVKASISENGRSVTLSTTGYELSIRDFDAHGAVISMAAIVFLVPEDDFVKQFREAVEGLKALAA
jgi:ABC-type Zn2+ transport system substrate-binding protein/surface adhesin